MGRRENPGVVEDRPGAAVVRGIVISRIILDGN